LEGIFTVEDRRSNVDDIYLAALERESGEARSSYLDEACAGNPELRRRVERLLQAHASIGSFLEAPAQEIRATLDQPVTEAPGAVIGPFKLLEHIGEGGMGTVWMAEQKEPIQRRVAIKVIKAGMDSKQVLARFEAERQALALMDHPNIARVLDAGTTEAGRPYFVMELVKGTPITNYCDDKHLSVRERLELFGDVCRAVQHAHQKGIIHRDLKPTNILIAPFDGKPVVKVIDFGVAKATGQRLTDATLFTGFGAVVGTPEYMSPEQAETNNRDIDTRSDIYSLGVLLYELLTGSTPLTKKRVKEAAILEVLRVIREEEPPRPSTRLSSTEELASISAQRRTEPAKLTKLVRGELDWIVMKALEKDRNRRYETANGFVADVQRHLNNETVQACPPSAWYRYRKLARRHQVGLTAAALVALSLALGTAVSVWQAVRAVQAEQLAQEKRKLADENLQKARQAVDEYFTLVSETKLLDAPGIQPLRKELLEAALRYYEAMLRQRPDDPFIIADLATTGLRVSAIYHALNRNDDAAKALAVALQHAERLRREYPRSVQQHRQLAGAFRGGRFISRTMMPTDPAALVRTGTRLLELWKSLASDNPAIEAFQYDLVFLHVWLGGLESGRAWAGEAERYKTAVAHLREAAAILERLSRAHPAVAGYRQSLSQVYDELWWNLHRAGREVEAERATERARELSDEWIAQFPGEVTSRAARARREAELASRIAAKQPQEAVKKLQEALREFDKLATEFPSEPEYRVNVAKIHIGLADLFAGPLQRPDDALRVYREGLKEMEKAAAEFPRFPGLRQDLGWSYRKVAAYVGTKPELQHEADDLRRRDIETFERLASDYPAIPSWPEQIAHAYRGQGFILRGLGRVLEAKTAFSAAIRVLEKSCADFPASQRLRDLLAETRSIVRDLNELPEQK
jgi:eukaryotic-like serine/threonine-protein kinase